jgi:hypothetical protein
MIVMFLDRELISEVNQHQHLHPHTSPTHIEKPHTNPDPNPMRTHKGLLRTPQI